VTGVASPPPEETRERGPSGAGAKTIVPSRFQEHPRPPAALQRVTGDPPPIAIQRDGLIELSALAPISKVIGVLEGRQAVSDSHDRRLCVRRERNLAFHDGCHRTGRDGLGDIAVTVVPFPAQSHEETPGDDPTGVDDGKPEGPNGGGGHQSAPGGGQEVVDANRRGHAVPCGFRRRVYQPQGWATPGAGRSGGMPK